MTPDPKSDAIPIPRLIFLTWKVRKIPSAVSRCVESFWKRNPAWTVVVASDEDCLKWLAARRPDDLKWYEALPKGILRADAMRLLWLHEMGGGLRGYRCGMPPDSGRAGGNNGCWQSRWLNQRPPGS